MLTASVGSQRVDSASRFSGEVSTTLRREGGHGERCAQGAS